MNEIRLHEVILHDMILYRKILQNMDQRCHSTKMKIQEVTMKTPKKTQSQRLSSNVWST